jgi:hypothetical protein
LVMEKRIEAGRYYSLIRLNGQVVKGKLIDWNGRYEPLKILEFNSGKIVEIGRLEEQEFASMKEIHKDGKEMR